MSETYEEPSGSDEEPEHVIYTPVIHDNGPLALTILGLVFVVLALVFGFAGFVIVTTPANTSDSITRSDSVALYIATEQGLLRDAWRWEKARQQRVLHSFTNALLVSVSDGKYQCQTSVAFQHDKRADMLARYNCDGVVPGSPPGKPMTQCETNAGTASRKDAL